MFRPRLPSASPRAGFALLITVTLLAFLVLLLVSLAGLTRVETQVASNSQELAQARRNALLAVNLALGQLQKYAGPDRRVTARSDLSAGAANPYFTGVWDATQASSSAASPMVWLVSGNESTPTAVNAQTSIPDPGAGNAAVWLLKDSVDAASQVKVLKQPITAGNVPGLQSGGVVGNFAYWVGDEGMKAKVNVVDPWETPGAATKAATGASDTDAANYRFVGLQRYGIEGVADASGARLAGRYPATDPVFKAALSRVLALPQLPYANADAADQTALGAATRIHFHDLTACSFSLLADVADGGLKKDLTAWLASPDGASNPPRDADYIADASAYMPTWGLIRSYAGIVADGTAKVPVAEEPFPVSPAQTTQGIHPIITYARMGYNVSCAGDDQPVGFHLFPVVVLWNPYNVPIAAHDYEMRFDYQDYYFSIILGKESEAVPDNGHTMQRRATLDKYAGASSDAFATAYLGYSAVTGAGQSTAGLPKTPIRFWLKSAEIEPGESLVFTLDATAAYQAGVSQMQANSPTRADNSAILYGPVMTAADRTDLYYLGNSSGQYNLSLRDKADDTIVYDNIQSSSSTAFFGASPVGTAFTMPDPGVVIGPLLYARTELYLSQGQHGQTSPSTWYGTNPRWLALFNPRAPHSLRMSGQSLSYYMDMQGITNAGPSFGGGNRASVGPGEDVSVPATDLVVQAFQKPGMPLFSLAQLQHANLSLMNLYPAYAVGNSLASVYVPADQTSVAAVVQPQQFPFRNLTTVYDLSYVLNRALWDKYYFSTVPATLTAPAQLSPDYHLPNARHVFHWRQGPALDGNAEFNELKTVDGAAAHLLVDGGFNVNSTSVQAWRALLSSHNGVATDPADATCTQPFPRYADPGAGVSNGTPWQGNRILSATQIDALSARIVDEVRKRGPFTSLGAFVNRSLKADTTADATRLKGALQAAIDAVDSDASITAANQINARAPFTDSASQISTLSTAANAIPAPSTGVIRSHWIGSDDDADAGKPYASRAAFAPGYLSQADLLTALGPVLTVRSDTFVIRAYGDVQNPATSAVGGRAWCEVVVQRLPEYLDESVNPLPTAAATGINAILGRRFRVVSFRWLTANDI